MNIKKESLLVKLGAWDVIDYKCRTGYCYSTRLLMKYGYKQYAAEVLAMSNQDIIDYADILADKRNPKGYSKDKREYLNLLAIKITAYRDTWMGKVKRFFRKKI